MKPGEETELANISLLSGSEIVMDLSLTVVSIVVVLVDSAGVVSSVILLPLKVFVVSVLFFSNVIPRFTAVFLRLRRRYSNKDLELT